MSRSVVHNLRDEAYAGRPTPHGGVSDPRSTCRDSPGGEIFYTRLFTRIMLYAMVACSLDLILGYGGMVSFGHAAFVGVGAYTVAILGHHGVTSGSLPGL